MHRLTALISKMLSNFQEWQDKRNRGKSGREKHQAGPGTYATFPQSESSPTGGVMSYNQMSRVSQVHGRPPSVVGSVRSFRSVRTVEERVEQLECTMDSIVKTQEEMNQTQAQILSQLTLISEALSKKNNPALPTDSGKK